MEIKQEKPSMISNYEVLNLLQDIQAGRGQKKPNKYQSNLATITYETIKCLENWPCANHTDEGIQAIMKELEPFNLSPAEKLQLVNLCPTSAVEIQLIVEESEERLSEEEIEKLLDIIAQQLPGQELEEAEDNVDFPEEEDPEEVDQ